MTRYLVVCGLAFLMMAMVVDAFSLANGFWMQRSLSKDIFPQREGRRNMRNEDTMEQKPDEKGDLNEPIGDGEKGKGKEDWSKDEKKGKYGSGWQKMDLAKKIDDMKEDLKGNGEQKSLKYWQGVIDGLTKEVDLMEKKAKVDSGEKPDEKGNSNEPIGDGEMGKGKEDGPNDEKKGETESGEKPKKKGDLNEPQGDGKNGKRKKDWSKDEKKGKVHSGQKPDEIEPTEEQKKKMEEELDELEKRLESAKKKDETEDSLWQEKKTWFTKEFANLKEQLNGKDKPEKSLRSWIDELAKGMDELETQKGWQTKKGEVDSGEKPVEVKPTQEKMDQMVEKLNKLKERLEKLKSAKYGILRLYGRHGPRNEVVGKIKKKGRISKLNKNRKDKLRTG